MGNVSTNESTIDCAYQSSNEEEEFLVRSNLENAIREYKSANDYEQFVDGLERLGHVFELYPSRGCLEGAESLFVKEGYLKSLSMQFTSFCMANVTVVHALLQVLRKLITAGGAHVCTNIIYSGIPRIIHTCIKQYNNEDILLEYADFIVGVRDIIFETIGDEFGNEIIDYTNIVLMALPKLHASQMELALQFLTRYCETNYNEELFYTLTDAIPPLLPKIYVNEGSVVALFDLLYCLVEKKDDNLKQRCDFIVDECLFDSRNLPQYHGLVVRFYYKLMPREELIEKMLMKQVDGGSLNMLERVTEEDEIIKLLDLVQHMCVDKRTKEVCRKNKVYLKKKLLEIEKNFKSEEVKQHVAGIMEFASK